MKTFEFNFKIKKPKHILEIGTFTGYSALFCLAEGLKKGGEIHTIDKNEELLQIQNKYFKSLTTEIIYFNTQWMRQ